MPNIILWAGVSLDGFIEGPGQDIGWHRVDEELHRHFNDELGQLAYRVYRYPALMLEEDTRANAIQERVGRVEIAFARFAQARSSSPVSDSS